MVKIYKQPFAHDGDAIAIPDASQPDGKMSSADGWTVDYQLPKTDPNYKPVGRQEMNGVFKEVTEALGQVQVQGSATWSADGAPYPINAQVYHNGKQWLALRANSVAPVEGEDWTELGGKQLAADYGYTQSLAGSGWQRLPSGLILQWGSFTTDTNGIGVIVFPIAFPTTAFQMFLTDRTGLESPAPAVSVVGVAALSTTGATIRTINASSSSPNKDAVSWLALGN